MEFSQLSERQQLIAATFNVATLAKRFQNGLTASKLQKIVKEAHLFSDWSCPASSEIEAIETDSAIVCTYLYIAATNFVEVSPMRVEKLLPTQYDRLKFLLNDWSHAMDSKGKFIIPSILKKMEQGVK